MKKDFEVNAKTEYNEEFATLEYYFTECQKEQITKAAVKEITGGDFYEIKISDFFSMTNGMFANIDINTVFGIYFIKAFPRFLEGFIETIEALAPPVSAKDKLYISGTKTIDFETSVYLFCREYFGLKSFKDVDGLTIGEYIVAKTDAFNKAVIEKNISKSIK